MEITTKKKVKHDFLGNSNHETIIGTGMTWNAIPL